MTDPKRNQLRDLAYRLEWGKSLSDDELKIVCETIKRAAEASDDTIRAIFEKAVGRQSSAGSS